MMPIDNKQKLIFCLIATCLTMFSCNSSVSTSKRSSSNGSSASVSQTETSNTDHTHSSNYSVEIKPYTATPALSKIKVGHHINTSAHEYLPIYDPSQEHMIFTSMDRTGFFDFKMDFTKAASAGGEDVYLSEYKDGIWTDARPITAMNTNAHESVSAILAANHYLVTGNYPEKIGPKASNNGTETTDIFEVKINGTNASIVHFPEPVNSIFTEADAIQSKNKKAMLFVSDRPGHVGDYHKKGWLWNNSTWGNTDVYVTFKKEGYWQVPINLGELVNSSGAERSPWLSEDGLTLYLSSNGYENNSTDLNIYAFKRSNTNDWTKWDGPFKMTEFCTPLDDWGFKWYDQKGAFVSHANALGFKPTQGGKDGDGGIRETNFRTGYTVIGAQTAALKATENTDIYWHALADQSFFTMPDVLFEVNAYKIKPAYKAVLNRLLDWCTINEDKTLTIVGHCDNSGTATYNQTLSEKRAESIKQYLLEQNPDLSIEAHGKGAQEPLNQNKTQKDKQQNRRVECFFK